jgi:hypothetical protein
MVMFVLILTTSMRRHLFCVKLYVNKIRQYNLFGSNEDHVDISDLNYYSGVCVKTKGSNSIYSNRKGPDHLGQK